MRVVVVVMVMREVRVMLMLRRVGVMGRRWGRRRTLEVLALLQQAQVVDEVRLLLLLLRLFDGRHRRGRVGVARVDELRPGQGPGARPGPREGLEVRVDLHQVRLLRRFRHGRRGVRRGEREGRGGGGGGCYNVMEVWPQKLQLRLLKCGGSEVRSSLEITESEKEKKRKAAPPVRKVCAQSHPKPVEVSLNSSDY